MMAHGTPVTKWLSLVAIAVLVLNCSKNSDSKKPSDEYPFKPPSNEVLDPFIQNQLLARSVNLGNALEAPNEGEWGVTLQAEYFQLIKEAGFTGVRIPIKWSGHAKAEPPYTIEPAFFARVDWAVAQALTRGLAAVINIHHYDEIMQNPQQHKDRFLGLWQQIAVHYQKYPDELMFELLNEPNTNLTAPIWNEMLSEAIQVVRQSNPYRTLIIGPVNWNSITALNTLTLPDSDRNIIVTFHYYNPFQFTHQGAEWVQGSNAWLGTTWTGTMAQRQMIMNEFAQAEAWAKSKNRPLFMGEFGAYSKADLNSRYQWTSFVAREAEQRKFSWAYWEFCSGFGIYDPVNKKWNDTLLKALIP
ncbi:MAG: glycoside hydrolase family 5 protein [candidate division KSB1 bacterium]|nr:glycoside hydrolase family 5 protein [candidate division KSB1 bacterium]MDZ7336340.1 glycoside hydrolase family 5 protein [candidate division KSB1 bacterium]MDZ7359055.1 glycoside hydrolase family 5 protein [candidate division KSB1 bacterium]MDZ7377250.1 glycoside hydrolase family 5 protein [candidate division KSB1 bacterium]MDZ7400024.1 glycoside hydrolase family 5 protein [candidate division KSB1 bacterium]